VSIVLTIDQQGSRRQRLGVARLVRKLNSEPDIKLRRPFERTVGDELQGVIVDAKSLPGVLRTTTEAGTWWVGIGFGKTGRLGPTTRESSGPAFYRARDAVQRAKKTPWGVAVSAGRSPAALELEDAISVWVTLLRARTPRGWEAANLRRQGLAEAEIAKRLRITQQAVNQRLHAAFFQQEERGSHLIERIGSRAIVEARSASNE
jgi:hypothetical protein